MERRLFWRSRPRLAAKALFACAVLCIATVSAFAQDEYTYVFHPNQEIRVANLPALTAASTDPSAVLAAALETIIRDQAVCCGKNSAL